MASQPPLRRSPSTALAKRESPAQESTAGLVKDAFGDAVEMLQAYVQLAVLEIREDAQAGVKVAVGFAVGAVFVVLALGFAGAAVVFALAPVLPIWIGCTIVAGTLALVGAIAFAVAVRKFKRHDFSPEETIAGVKEDAAWIAEKLS